MHFLPLEFRLAKCSSNKEKIFDFLCCSIGQHWLSIFSIRAVNCDALGDLFTTDLDVFLAYFFTSSYASVCKWRKQHFKAFLSCLLQVFLTECAGPLLIYLMFYFRLPFIYAPKYDFTSSKHWVVQWVSAGLCFYGCVAMLLLCITQSQALQRCPLYMTNSCEAYCYVDDESGPSVMDCHRAMS